MKTSALTVGAITLLSQGIALASGESGSGSGCDPAATPPVHIGPIIKATEYDYVYKGVDPNRVKYRRYWDHCDGCGHSFFRLELVQ
jgi:hypothetical protein